MYVFQVKMSSKWPVQFPILTLPVNRGRVVTTVSLGLAILGVITAYFRWRRRGQKSARQVPDGSEHSTRLNGYLNGGINKFYS